MTEIEIIETEINTAVPDSYQRSFALRRMADYLNDTETAFSETETFRREHWEDIHMREWLDSQFAQRNEWQKAIEIYADDRFRPAFSVLVRFFHDKRHFARKKS